MILVYHGYNPGDCLVIEWPKSPSDAPHHWRMVAYPPVIIAMENLQFMDDFPSYKPPWLGISHVWLPRAEVMTQFLGLRGPWPTYLVMLKQCAFNKGWFRSRLRRGWRVWRQRSRNISSRSCMEWLGRLRTVESCWIYRCWKYLLSNEECPPFTGEKHSFLQ